VPSAQDYQEEKMQSALKEQSDVRGEGGGGSEVVTKIALLSGRYG